LELFLRRSQFYVWGAPIFEARMFIFTTKSKVKKVNCPCASLIMHHVMKNAWRSAGIAP
jgi:hypothetical protein